MLAKKSRTGAVARCTLGLAAFVPMTGQAQTIAHGYAQARPRMAGKACLDVMELLSPDPPCGFRCAH